MTRPIAALAAAAVVALLPALTRAEGPSHDLGCAVARAVDTGTVCGELALYSREGARRMGEELAQLLEAPARAKAIKLIEDELAEKGRKPGATPCPPARPLCSFDTAALTDLKAGLADSK